MSTVEAMSSMRREGALPLLLPVGADGQWRDSARWRVRASTDAGGAVGQRAECRNHVGQRADVLDIPAQQDSHMAHPAVVRLPQFGHGVSVSLMTSFGSNGCSA